MASYMDLITEFIKLTSVGVISGLFGAFLALRRHKHEKWWEMRAEAYKSVIESLSDITALYETRNANWEQTPCEPDEVSKELASVRNVIRKHRDLGAFLFSKSAEAALTEFVDFQIDNKHVTDPSDVYGPYGKNARHCLEKVVELSKKDLAINERWL